MFHFGSRKSHDWHEKVNSMARQAGPPVVFGSTNPAFPWSMLPSQTDLYLKKKGYYSPEECDRRLLALILEHGEMHIAVAACAHRMSRKALQSIITDALEKNTLSIQTQGLEAIGSNHVQVLEAMIIAHHVNILAFAEPDLQVARTLIRCFEPGSYSTSQRLEIIVKLLINAGPRDLFVCSYARMVVHGYAAALSGEIRVLKESSQWLTVRSETEWFSVLLDQPLRGSPRENEVMTILSEQFPDWKIWTRWNESDAHLARAIDTRQFEQLIKSYITIRAENSFICQDFCRLVQMYSSSLSRQVQALVDSHKWLAAHEKTAWLSKLAYLLPQSSDRVLQVTKLIGVQFPDWRIWAEWNEFDSKLARALEACQQLLDPGPIKHTENQPPQRTQHPTGPSTSRKLELLIKVQVSGIPRKGSHVYLEARKLTQLFCTELSLQILTLKESHEWIKARNETEWLTILRDSQSSPATSEVVSLLEAQFPDWKVWTEWGESDSKLAEALTHAFHNRHLEGLIEAQVNENPAKNSFLLLDALNLTRAYAAELSSQVQILKNSGQWMAAHAETQWLSMLLDPQLPPAASEVVLLLEAQFPDWRAWAEWSESDSKLAKALIPCLGFPNDTATSSLRLKIVIDSLATGVSTKSVLYAELHDMARKFSGEVARVFHHFKLQGQWYRAQKECQWFSAMLNGPFETYHTPGWTEAIQILDDGFADWRLWARWQPDVQRLFVQEKLSVEQHTSLLDFLALEGPDFVWHQHVNMREALIAQYDSSLTPEVCWGDSTRLKVPDQTPGGARDPLERLSDLINAACIAETLEINLLMYLCCRREAIDEITLNILEANSRMGSSQVSSDVLRVLKPQKEPRRRSSQMRAVMQLLPLLGRPWGQALRDALSPYLVELISDSMREMQAILGIQQENASGVRELHAFGLGIQAAEWLQPLLDPTLGILISNWPSTENIFAMNALQSEILRRSHGEITTLGGQLDEYYTECLIQPGTIDQDARNLIEALLLLWHRNPDDDRSNLAFKIAEDQEMSISIRSECLRQLPTVPNRFICDLSHIYSMDAKAPDTTSFESLQALASLVNLNYEKATCWRSVLYHRLKDPESTLFQCALTHLPADRWLRWLSHLQDICMDMAGRDDENPPEILQQALHDWIRRICRSWSTISRLEGDIGSGPATQTLLLGFQSNYSESIFQILDLLEFHYQDSEDGESLQPAVRATIALLNRAEADNAKEILLALSMLTHTSTDGNDAYLRILDVCQQTSIQVAHVLLVGWLQNPDLTLVDQWALGALGNILHIRLDDDNHPIMNALDDAVGYVTCQVTSLLDEANALDGLRRTLKAVDPEGTSALLAELEIEDASALEDEIASLPSELVNVVEMVAEDIVELHFPLTHHTELQRAGMGTGDSQSLVVRLIVGGYSLPSGFCMHLDNELEDYANSEGHSPWLVLDDYTDSGASSCHGRVNRATFQLGFVLSRYLTDIPKPLEQTYRLLKQNLDALSSNCMVCGRPLGIELRRSTVCGNFACSETFLRAHLDMQLHDLHNDNQVGELLLTAVQAAATSTNYTALLPGCPANLVGRVSSLLGRLPPGGDLLSSDLHDGLTRSSEDSLILLKWIFGHFGGFLVSASGQMRIPSLPGIHQFLLANAAPDLELAFTRHMGSSPTSVVFHGTSLDRLYAILCQGLRVCSGDSSLRRHGAAHGNGIYVADEPATAMGYANSYTPPSGAYWRSSTIDNVRVLLGCEAASNIPSRAHGIYVVPNPNMLILRYIFLVPTTVTVPVARHVVPAMTSVFASLRSGSL